MFLETPPMLALMLAELVSLDRLQIDVNDKIVLDLPFLKELAR